MKEKYLLNVSCEIQGGNCEECSFAVSYLKFGCATFSLTFEAIW